jgi:hypothetical protein
MDSEENKEWTPPPPPTTPPAEPSEPARMSELATLRNIFFEPGNTFEDLRRKPRFIIAAIIISLMLTAYGFSLAYKVGDESIRRAFARQLENAPSASAMSSDQKEANLDLQVKIIGITKYAMPVFWLIFLGIGGLLYWLGAKAFGGSGGFLHGLSAFVYSWFPPVVISGVANLSVLLFKPAEEIDFLASQRGIISSNLGFLFGTDASPVLVTLVSVFDLFAIWGWVLAAIGLRIMNKISSASAWAIVIIFALVGVTFRVIGALMQGAPN